MMGLRVSDGVDVDRVESLAGQKLDAQQLRDLKSLELVVQNGRRLAPTPKGFALLNQIVAALLP